MESLKTFPESVLSYLDLRTSLLCFSVFLAVCWATRRTRNPRNLPPGPFGIPILGCLPTLGFALYRSGLELPQLFASFVDKYGKIFSLQFGGKCIILLSDYETIKEAFQNPHLSDRPYNHLVEELGKTRNIQPGVVHASGESWKQQRRFTLSTLRNFGVGKRSFEDQISIETKALVNEVLLQQHKPFDPRYFLGLAVSNVICSVVFGKRYEYSNEDLKRLLDILNKQVKLVGGGGLHFFFPIVRYLQPRKQNLIKGNTMKIVQFICKIIDEHRQVLDPDNLNDFIDVFLTEIQTSDNPHLNEGTLVSTIVNLFGAGSETTATTLRWSLLYMIAYPDIQQAIHQEIDDIVGRNRLPRLSDMPQLPYTEATLLEVQRIATVFPLGGPHCAAEDTTLNGFNILKGALVIGNLWAVHHDPEVWKDPSDFNPSRFLDQSGNVRHPPEFIPFSTGRRICLGENLAKMEVVLFFTHLMHQFAFKKPTESTQLSLEGNVGLTNAPKPFEMVVTPRDRSKVTGYC